MKEEFASKLRANSIQGRRHKKNEKGYKSLVVPNQTATLLVMNEYESHITFNGLDLTRTLIEYNLRPNILRG